LLPLPRHALAVQLKHVAVKTLKLLNKFLSIWGCPHLHQGLCRRADRRRQSKAIFSLKSFLMTRLGAVTYSVRAVAELYQKSAILTAKTEFQDITRPQSANLLDYSKK